MNTHPQATRSATRKGFSPWPGVRFILLGALMASLHCQPRRPSVDEQPASAPTLRPDDRIVAQVDGIPIVARRVAELARLTGQTPQATLQKLIDFELLAAEARRRGHHRSWQVRGVEQQALVYRFMKQEFEQENKIDTMPDEVVLAAYNKNKGVFVRPELRKVAHILVFAREQQVDETTRQKAHRVARTIYDKARRATSVEEFLSIGRSFEDQQPFKLQVTEISTPVHERANLVKEFRDAALALSHPGDISPPVQTNFGSHIIYFVDERPALNRSFEDARAEVRQKEHPFWLRTRFLEFTDELRFATKVTGYTGDTRRSSRP